VSEQGAEQNRSEQPTPFKLMRSRERGVVARGMDLGFLTALAGFTAYVWFMGAALAASIAQTMHDTLVIAPQLGGGGAQVIAVFGKVLGAALRPVGMLVGAVFLTVLVFEVVQTGGVFSTTPLKPDFSRLNPAAGLKRVFSVRLLIETLKSLLKLVVYTVLGGMVVLQAVRLAPTLTDAAHLAGSLQTTLFRLLGLLLAAALGFAVLDQLLSRRDFLKRMRMSRREVRRETRDREGDARLKQNRKKMHREFTKASQSLRNIRGADVLVTNPTHFAVALRYDPQTMEAPMVVSRGAQRFALRLRRAAFLYGVVIVRNPPLARALYRCDLNQQVPEALYPPIADLYRSIRRDAQPHSAEAAHV
jgi:flagellar biosynthetic protein FlhB